MQTQSVSISQKPLTLEKTQPIHFVGIGGVGMSALAKILLEQGFTVSGSDGKENALILKLRELGATVAIGHAAENVPANAIVVATTAVTAKNPEIAEAQKQGLTIYHRSDLLREILKKHEISIGLTGTHGKTSMTGMTGLILEDGGLNPTIVAGGVIPGLGTNAKGSPDFKYAVAELDESDGTIVQYQPTYSVIANLELDHADHYKGGLEAVKDTFRQYLSALSRESTVLFNMDCPTTAGLYQEYRNQMKAIKVYTASVPETIEDGVYYLQNVTLHLEGGYQADVFKGYDQLGRIWLQVPGLHNISNALMSAALGHLLGVKFEIIEKTLENFTGMGRRFEKLGKVNGATIIDDYAHHPTEVKATLKAAREFNRIHGRVIAMFQPHRYQRLQSLWDEFLEAFDDADEVIITDVYGAGEAPLDGISGERFAKALPHSNVEYWPSSDWALVAARLKTILTPGDLFITLGAGDVTRLGRDVVASENAASQAGQV